MRKLENSDTYKRLIQKIKKGDENSKKELVNFTFFEFRENFIESIKKLKIEINDKDIDGLIYPMLYEYIEKSNGFEIYSLYKACVIKAIENRLIKYKKENSINNKNVVFDHTSKDIDKDIIINEVCVDPDEFVLRQEFNDIFRYLIFKYLRPQEQTILIQYFGLDGKGTTTLEALGRKYNLTRERIRQVVEMGLNSIKRKLKIRKDNVNIKDYKDDFRV